MKAKGILNGNENMLELNIKDQQGMLKGCGLWEQNMYKYKALKVYI